ncbi:MAG: hypothetical protein DI536_08185 [Archangium gephyra]|uniref:Uncharacterized protein n=1 Tax=Archangium gephyra TaxID=48 RepID=A0A2W5TIR6_9BACT|nr:MAG: hypothetical protein DI536_08185 [Archangium gephyra]
MSAPAHEMLALIAAVSRKDRGATRTLVERLFPVVRARVRLVQARRSDLRALDTNDLIQQVFVVLLEADARQLAQWDPARGASLEGFVGMVTEREVGNAGQRAGARQRFEVMTDAPADAALDASSPEAQTSARDAVSRLGAFLDAQLPPRGRVVLKCLYSDGLDADETARALGVNRQVVYNWQHRIRSLAREFQTGGV